MLERLGFLNPPSQTLHLFGADPSEWDAPSHRKAGMSELSQEASL